MKLSDKLESISTYPFHMPGHKRNSAYGITASTTDITEIDGFDNLHSPKEILKELEDDIAKIFGYKKSIISVNGSTCGILAAISAVCKNGDKILIARNCHKSVYNACFINKLRVEYIEPEYNSKFGCCGRIAQSAVDKALKAHPDACAVVITSPTYEGIISNIKCDIPLIIDSAHGAHFGFADYLPERAYGDIVIQSLHKTLPCLTQTAVVHINNTKLVAGVKKYMDIFETSSPSYVLLSSVDRCVDFLKKSKDDFALLKSRLERINAVAKSLEGIHLLDNDDITRMVIAADGYTGIELADKMRNDYSIEVEGCSLKYVILITSVCDTKKGFDMLEDALKGIERRSDKKFILPPSPVLAKKAYDTYEIHKTAQTIFTQSDGKVCGEYVYAYPPGCPLIVPGEIISSDIIDYISYCIEKGVNILCDSDLLPDKILTKA